MINLIAYTTSNITAMRSYEEKDMDALRQDLKELLTICKLVKVFNNDQVVYDFERKNGKPCLRVSKETFEPIRTMNKRDYLLLKRAYEKSLLKMNIEGIASTLEE